MPSLVLLSSLCATLSAGPPADDALAVSAGDRWPGFRGVGTGWTAAQDLPREWSEAAWSRELVGEGQSSPVVLGDLVVVTSVEGANKERNHVAALRLGDGVPLWMRSFPASVSIKMSDMVSKAAPTPALDEHRVYAFFESGDLICLDHEGELLWRHDLHQRCGPFEGNHGIGSSPVLCGDVLCLLIEHEASSRVLAFDAATGEDRWVVERDARVSWSTPVHSAAHGELVVSSKGTVEGFALEDGALRWRVEGIEGNTVPSPTAFGAHVLVAQSKGPGVSLLRRPDAGAAAAVLWSGDRVPPSGFSSPLVFGDSALLLNRAGVLSSLVMNTGEEQWEERLSSGSAWASPVTDGETLWYFGREGSTSVVRWTPEGPEELAVNHLETTTEVLGVAAVDGCFVLRERSRVLCLRAERPEAESEGPGKD